MRSSTLGQKQRSLKVLCIWTIVTITGSLVACGTVGQMETYGVDQQTAIIHPEGQTAAGSSVNAGGGNKQYPNFTDEEAAIIEQLKQRNSEKTKDVQTQQGDMERERRVQRDLVRELQRVQSYGCRATMPITAIKIAIKGHHEETPRDFINERRNKPGIVEKLKALEGGGTTVLFDLGNQILLTNNEVDNELFRPDGELISTNYDHLTVGDIRHIKLKKGGISAIFDEEVRSVLMGLSDWRRKTASENYRLSLESLSIYVTNLQGQEFLLYQVDGLDTILQYGSLEWEATGHHSLKRNAAYKELMSESDCQS